MKRKIKRCQSYVDKIVKLTLKETEKLLQEPTEH